MIFCAMGFFVGPSQALGYWHLRRANKKAYRPQKSCYCYIFAESSCGLIPLHVTRVGSDDSF